MKKIILATIGLAMFATPLAAENPRSGYPSGPQHISGGTDAGPFSHTRAPERFDVTPSGASQTFGLTAPGSLATSHSSMASGWPNQDLRDRYGRIDR